MKKPVFIIEKNGDAYYENKTLNKVCKPFKFVNHPKYPGYRWKFNYNENEKKLDWFKGYVLLMEANGGVIKYIGMNKNEFLSLGGVKVDANGASKTTISNLRKMGLNFGKKR